LVLVIFVFIEFETVIWILLALFSFVKNCRNVLLKFSVRRLLWNQSIISVITVLIVFLKSSGFVFDMTILVSSANNIVSANLFIDNGKSFIYVRKSSGPCTEPCGTPCFTCSQVEITLLDFVSFIRILWYLLLK